MNIYLENVGLEKARAYIARVADWHGVNLHPDMTNEQAIEYFDKKYPSSDYTPDHWKVMGSSQPEMMDIHEVVSN